METKIIYSSQPLTRLISESRFIALKDHREFVNVIDFVVCAVSHFDEKYFKVNKDECVKAISACAYSVIGDLEEIRNEEFYKSIAIQIVGAGIDSFNKPMRCEIGHILKALKICGESGLTINIIALLEEFINIEQYFEDCGINEFGKHLTCVIDTTKTQYVLCSSMSFGYVDDTIEPLVHKYITSNKIGEMFNFTSSSDVLKRTYVRSCSYRVSILRNRLSEIVSKGIDEEKIKACIAELFRIMMIEWIYIDKAFDMHPIGSYVETGEVTGDILSEAEFNVIMTQAEDACTADTLQQFVNEVAKDGEDTDRVMNTFGVNYKGLVKNKEKSDFESSGLIKRLDYTNIVPWSKKPVLIFNDLVVDNLLTILNKKQQRNAIIVGPKMSGKRTLARTIVNHTSFSGCEAYEINFDNIKKYDGNVIRILNEIVENIIKTEGEKFIVIDNISNKIGVEVLSIVFQRCFEMPNIHTIMTCDDLDDIEDGLKEYSTVLFNAVAGPNETYQMIVSNMDAISEYFGIKLNKKIVKAIVGYVAENEWVLPGNVFSLIDDLASHFRISKNTPKGNMVKVTSAEFIGELKQIYEDSVGLPFDLGGIPETEEISLKKVAKLSNNLKMKIYGQDRACDIVDSCLKVSSVGLNDANKTVCNLMFVGPTGVGKTELAKVVADTLEIPLIRYNMTEYQDQISVNKLIGSAPGYVGHDQGGKLVKDILENPQCVLLLDEIEKAHPYVYNTLLNIMDDAKLSDNLGNTADFTDVILIMTSNAGARNIGSRRIGFNSSEEDSIIKDEAMDAAIKETFSPEFINRLTEIVKFNFLNKESGIKIINKKIKELEEKLKPKGITVKFESSAINHILDKGITNEFGAREINRIFIKEINTEIAKIIISNPRAKKMSLVIDAEDGKFKVKKESTKKVSQG